MHDVSITYHHIQSRNPDKGHFFSLNVSRLNWLEEYFLSYLETLKAASNAARKDFLSSETYEATYTINHGFSCPVHKVSSKNG